LTGSIGDKTQNGSDLLPPAMYNISNYTIKTESVEGSRTTSVDLGFFKESKENVEATIQAIVTMRESDTLYQCADIKLVNQVFHFLKFLFLFSFSFSTSFSSSFPSSFSSF